MSYRDDIENVARLSLPWEVLNGKNILVTGATGLIGSCLVNILMSRKNRDYCVFAMGRNVKRMDSLFGKYDNDKCFYRILGDITSPLELQQDFNYIIHAASGASPADFVQHPVEVMKANIIGVTNLLEYGLKHNMNRMLYVSSGEVYGEGDGRVFTEDYSGYVNPTNPRSCYPSSKRAAETLCASYVKEYNTDVVIARPSHTYGPHFTESDNRVYAQFIRNVLRGENIVMKSSGTQTRSWCYVVDCASALLYILLKGEKGEAYNIADDSSNISIRNLANMIAGISGREVIAENVDQEEKEGYNPVTKSVFSTAKIESLGWKVTGSMEEKIAKTIKEIQRESYEILKGTT